MTCLLEQTLCMLKPHFPGSGQTLSTDGIFWFPLVPHVDFASALINCLYLDTKFISSILFSFPCFAEEGSVRVVWWAPGVQPGPSHYIGTK